MKYTILIIDDNKQFTNHLQQILLQEISNLIKNIYVYNNSEKVINDIEQLKPDILLLDLKMPKVDGFKILEKIKNKKIMTIIISGEPFLINNIELYNSQNIKKIYIKPFKNEQLIKCLKYICNEKEQEIIQEDIENELCIFKFNKGSIGYKYLVKCLVKTYENSSILNNIEKELFPIIAKEVQVKKVENIKWSIQKTIKSMIRYTNKEKIAEYFPNIKIPTPKLFITTLNNIILKKYKR